MCWLEIETDKAMIELEAAADGEVGKLLIEAGTPDIPINTPIAFLLREGEDAEALEHMATSAPDPAAPAPAAPAPVAGSAEATPPIAGSSAEPPFAASFAAAWKQNWLCQRARNLPR